MSRFPYAVSRRAVYARQGVVATSQPLASQAGLFILREGGNAIDAAIATAAALTVVEPASNGIGGDAFAIVYANGRVHGLNGSGRAPQGCSRDQLRSELENGDIPIRGWAPVTVPGAPRAWADLHKRFGCLPFEQLFKPAIHYARAGYPLSPVLAEYWRRETDLLSSYEAPVFQPWKQTFAPQGFTPRAGEIWCSEGHARTLDAIARSEADEFYRGRIAEQIDAFSRETGGWLRFDDLAQHRSDWVEPLSVDFKGFEVWEIPPNSQAIAVLQALKILTGMELPAQRDDGEGLHLQIEAMKLAFADTLAYVGDPTMSTAPQPETLLCDRYIAGRRALIGEFAMMPAAGTPPQSDTVYLCAADASGMMVSFIQSNYLGFGSGIVVPGTGIALHNRGHDFTLEPGHPNEFQPGKRPYHTLMPGFLTRQGEAIGPFGVMGATMQPQGQLQVLLNTVIYGMDPQAALDATRWRWVQEREIHVEHAMPAHLVEFLRSRGHDVHVAPAYNHPFGRGQIIWRRSNGVFEAGSDSRTDGCAAGY